MKKGILNYLYIIYNLMSKTTIPIRKPHLFYIQKDEEALASPSYVKISD